jgi:hypothetical protein
MTNTFNDTVRAWREAPFPPGSSIDVLDEIHADLALYDSWVADSLLPYLDHGVWSPAKVDVLGSLDALTQQIEELNSDQISDTQAVAHYLNYTELLRAVYAAFLQVEDRP